MDLAGLVVLITGASQGIGACLGEILDEYGATVVGVYNNTPIKSLYDTYKCDISKEEEIKELFKKVLAKHEKIDVLVNCAAIAIDGPIEDKTKEEFMKVLEVNLVGTFLMCQYACKYMSKGTIINMSSTDASLTYTPIAVDYCASKAGVEILTKCLAMQFPKLKVCALAPNWVDTNSVLAMEPNYLQEEMQRVKQKELLTKESVAMKIIEIMINDDISSGEIIKMGVFNE